MVTFPNSPSANQEVTIGSKVWYWDATEATWRIKTTGAVGPQGNQGLAGPTGSAGTNGNQGFQGNQGRQGFQGIAGTNGTNGNQGFQGPTGTVDAFYGATAPTGSSLRSGDVWFNSSVGNFFIHLNDGDSFQWVEIGGEKGPTGPAGVSVFSYHGHIEAPVNKTFYIDPRLPANRTITEFYAISGTGSCTAGLSAGGTSIGSLSVGVVGATASLSNTSLSAGDSLEMTISNTTYCFDLRFAIRYTQ